MDTGLVLLTQQMLELSTLVLSVIVWRRSTMILMMVFNLIHAFFLLQAAWYTRHFGDVGAKERGSAGNGQRA